MKKFASSAEQIIKQKPLHPKRNQLLSHNRSEMYSKKKKKATNKWPKDYWKNTNNKKELDLSFKMPNNLEWKEPRNFKLSKTRLRNRSRLEEEEEACHDKLLQLLKRRQSQLLWFRIMFNHQLLQSKKSFNQGEHLKLRNLDLRLCKNRQELVFIEMNQWLQEEIWSKRVLDHLKHKFDSLMIN